MLYSFAGDDDGVDFGAALDMVGDVDGDGLSEVAVGAYRDFDASNHSGSAEVFAGNDLYLQAEYTSVPEGVLFYLDIRGGGAIAPYALFLVDVDGVPYMFPLRVGKLDGFGETQFSARVPRGFGTHDLHFVAFACDNPSIHRGVAESSIATIHTTP